MATVAKGRSGPKPGRSKKKPLPVMLPVAVPEDALSDAELVVWKQLESRMPKGYFVGGDEDLIVIYCRLWVRWEKAVCALEQSGTVGEGSQGQPKRTPEEEVEHRLLMRLQSVSKQLGISRTASARAAAPVEIEKEEDADLQLLPFAKAV